ncbi:hypothetical protein HYC85_031257 [Camellia sinensis]|uniref:Anaphase-promoting complex subunit 4 WD40 domain-containing protein n=1 Tax=Camellia sinensis TaxID=4442 RepID=A0A7J7FU00_CAMSI|nr:hypothetical protein HYC85_031257 [Camellia sinensis]
MIAAISWVPKGVSRSIPAVAEPPSKEEIEEILNSRTFERSEESENEDHDEDMVVDAAKQGDEVAHALVAADALGKASLSTTSVPFQDIADSLRELDMEHYDEEDDGVELIGTGIGDAYYPSNDMDPYLKDQNDDDSEEVEDMTITAEDAVIVCARNEDDVSHLEACRNFIAVGSMEPSIEIWDLDIVCALWTLTLMDEVQPLVVLGGISEKKKKGKKSIKYKKDSHTDSVLGLAWNKEYRNILASASADKLVKIWDVATGKCDITMEHHTDKARVTLYSPYCSFISMLCVGRSGCHSGRNGVVTACYAPLRNVDFQVQAVAWNHHVPQVLLSGSFDHTVVMKDGRIPSHTGFKWSVSADVETVAWDPHTEHSFVVSLEDGTVEGFDIRAAKSDQSSDSKPSFTLHAHDKAVCTVSYNPLAPNLLATGSTDKMVKLWDLSNNQPSCVASNNPKAGAVFSISFSEDNPFLLAIGGSKGKLEVWDTLSDAGVSRRYGKYSNRNIS